MKQQQVMKNISSCFQFYDAARQATTYYHTACQKRPGLLIKASISLNDIYESNNDLEKTYIIRIFAEFEKALRDYYKNGMTRPRRPNVEVLMERVASNCYVHADVLRDADSVRDYRNGLIHDSHECLEIPIRITKSYLGKYLSFLPQNW